MLAVIISTHATRQDILYFEINSSKTSENTAPNQHSVAQRAVSRQFRHERIEFERRNDLIYHLNRFTRKARLCISKSLVQDIFKMTHDDLAHVDFHRAYAAIVETLYIRRLAHFLRQYIEYCLKCLLNQIKRHKSYDSLNSITISKIPFHTIVMDFVLALPRFDHEKFDIMLTVTDKFFKGKLLISEKNT